MFKSKKAFTLIELLVVIAIIGILATISVLALSNARVKSRDAKRAGDIKQIQTALELFFNDNNRYPTAEEWNTGKIYSTTTDSTSTYMQIIPTAPTPADGNCDNNKNTVSYTPTSDGSSYSVSFCLGNTTGTLTPGPKCLTPGGIIDVDCSVSVIPPEPQQCDGDFVAHNFNSCGDSLVYCNQTYNTVQIGSQCWFKENINIGDRIDGVLNQGNFSDGIQKYCYNNKDTNPAPSTVICDNGQNCGGCDTDGGLYQWHMATGKDASCDNFDCDANPSDPCCTALVQGICPIGWHIPSDTEWDSLISGLTPSPGYKLKSNVNNVWSDSSNNSSNFSALPTGLRYTGGNFYNRGVHSDLWLSPAHSNSSNALFWYLVSGDAGAARTSDLRIAGMPVRCLKN